MQCREKEEKYQKQQHRKSIVQVHKFHFDQTYQKTIAPTNSKYSNTQHIVRIFVSCFSSNISLQLTFLLFLYFISIVQIHSIVFHKIVKRYLQFSFHFVSKCYVLGRGHQFKFTAMSVSTPGVVERASKEISRRIHSLGFKTSRSSSATRSTSPSSSPKVI